MRTLLLLGAAGLALSSTAVGAQAPVTDARSLVREMHARYDGRWYRTLAFTQQTTFSAPGQPVRVESWDEYGAMPGRLRIEFPGGRGVIFSGDSTYSFAGDSLVRRERRRNELLILGFDVYAQPPETTLRILAEEGFDLSRFRTDHWQGRPVYVVGAAAADSSGKQFWVDAERLVFVRMLSAPPRTPDRVQDLRFNGYVPAGGGWIAPEVEIVVDGQRVFHEVYSNVRVDLPLDASLWEPERWRTAVHP